MGPTVAGVVARDVARVCVRPRKKKRRDGGGDGGSRAGFVWRVARWAGAIPSNHSRVKARASTGEEKTFEKKKGSTIGSERPKGRKTREPKVSIT